MNEQSHIDFEGLAAFIAGELEGAEHEKWVRWVAESPENKRLYSECLALFTPDVSDESGASYDTNAAWELVKERISPVEIEMPVEEEKSPGTQWWRWAAVFLLGAALITYLVQFLGDERTEIAQDSGISTYVLPDSSLVTLNGAASISYNDDYNNGNRDVTLVGKGYFDVRKNDSLAFNVNTRRGILTVLGTAFLIEETRDSLYVIVERGRVEVGLKEAEERLELTHKETGIIQFDSGELKEYRVATLNTLYWANKRLAYRQTPLADVLDEIGVIFDKEIVYDRESIDSCKITGLFRDQNFEEIIENIALSFPINYTMTGDRVEITSNGCSN